MTAQESGLPYWDWAAKKIRNDSSKLEYDLLKIVKKPRIKLLTYDESSTAFIDKSMLDDERMGCYGVSDIQDITSDGSTDSKIVTIPVNHSLFQQPTEG